MMHCPQPVVAPISREMDAPVVSRLNRFDQKKDDKWKHKAEMFFRDLRRAKLSPTMRALAELVCEDSLCLGLRAAVYPSWRGFVKEAGAVLPVLDLSDANISLAMMGNRESGEAGLDRMRIVRVERVEIDGCVQWLVTPQLDWSLWGCKWRNSRERREQRKAAVRASWAAALPFLPSLAPEPDLVDALDVVGGESVAELPVAGRTADAPWVRAQGNSPPYLSRTSECRNTIVAETAPKAGGIPTFGTPRARGSVQNELYRKTVQNNLYSIDRDALKGKLHSGDQREFSYAAGLIIGEPAWSLGSPGREPNAPKWIARWKAGGECRRLVLVVFDEILSPECMTKTTPAQHAQDVWARIGGLEIDHERYSRKIKLGDS